MTERPTTVIAAFFSNLVIAVAKFVAFFFTGSSSLLAEGFHSVADTGNQALLMLGHRRSKRSASAQHPFGFAPERYFWAFVVAIVLFSLGSLLSFFEGWNKLTAPHPIESPAWAFAVLGIGVIAESIALRLALKQANKDPDMSWFQYIRTTKAGENPVVLLEDSAAETGLLTALIGVTLAVVTGDGRWDAVGSIGIGLILAFVSGLLAVEMKSLLIGEAASDADLREIEAALESEPRLEKILVLRTMHRGPEDLLVNARVELSDDLGFRDVATAVSDLKQSIRDRVPIANRIFIEPGVGGEADDPRRRDSASPDSGPSSAIRPKPRADGPDV